MSGSVEAPDTVGELERRLARLAYEARTGDPVIEAELVQVEDEIAAHERMVRLEALARAEHARHEAEDRERERYQQQTRDARAARHALHKRELVLRALQRELDALGDRVRAVLEADAEAERAAKHAGQPVASLKQTTAELVAITCRDAGLDEEPIGYVRNSVRASILKQYPTGEAPAKSSAVSKTVPACTVCASPQRDALVAALASGMSYREVSSAFALSRSALSRHVIASH